MTCLGIDGDTLLRVVGIFAVVGITIAAMYLVLTRLR